MFLTQDPFFAPVCQELFEDFNREVQPRFTAQTYDLMKHNCNNYTNEASQFLLGKGIPECELYSCFSDYHRDIVRVWFGG